MLTRMHPHTRAQVFGEVGLEDMLSEAHCSGDSDGGLSRLNSCPQNVYWGIFLLIFYMLFSNILLVNLLIAMMNSTYQNVDEAAIEIWSLQNIDLLREFRGPFPFPPPLNVVYYIYQGVVVAGTWLIRLPTRARYGSATPRNTNHFACGFYMCSFLHC